MTGFLTEESSDMHVPGDYQHVNMKVELGSREDEDVALMLDLLTS